MGQYELAKAIHERSNPTSIEELVRITGLSKGSVDDQIRKLNKKGYVEESSQSNRYVSDMSDSELNDLKPITIREMMKDQ